MNFVMEDYGKNVVMHCPEEWMARKFLDYLDSKGKKWINGSSYKEIPEYENYKERTAYRFNYGQFGSIDWYEKNGYKILRFEDFFFGDDEDFTVEKEDADCIGTFLNNFTLN